MPQVGDLFAHLSYAVNTDDAAAVEIESVADPIIFIGSIIGGAVVARKHMTKLQRRR